MRILEATIPYYVCEHKGVTFNAKIRFRGDGSPFLDVVSYGNFLIENWDDLSEATNQDTESLYEQLDDAVYNVTPEVYESR